MRLGTDFSIGSCLTAFSSFPPMLLHLQSDLKREVRLKMKASFCMLLSLSLSVSVPLCSQHYYNAQRLGVAWLGLLLLDHGLGFHHLCLGPWSSGSIARRCSLEVFGF